MAKPLKGFLRRGVVDAAEKIGGERLKSLAKHPVASRAVGAALGAAKTTGLEAVEEGLQGAVQETGLHIAAKMNDDIENRPAGDILKSAVEQTKEALPGLMVLGGAGGGAKFIGAVERFNRISDVQKQARVKGEILKAAEEGHVPSRDEWRKWGFSPDDARSRNDRRDAVTELAEEIKQQEAVPPVEPEAVLPSAPEAAPPAEPVAEQQTPPEGSPQQPMPEAQPQDVPPVTSIKNEIVDELRAGRGDAKIDDVPRESVEGWYERAEKQIQDDPGYSDRIVREITDKPRNLSDEETAAVQIHYRRLNTAFAKATDRLFAASESGNVEETAKAQTDANIVFGQLRAVEEASRIAGREWGRAGVSRQIELATDYSPASLVRRARVAKGGKPLTPEESEKVKAISDRVAQLESKLDAHKEATDTKESENAVDEAIKDFKPKKSLRKPKKAAAQEKVDLAWGEFKAKLPGMSPAKFLSEEKGALDLELLASGVKLATAYVELGVVTLEEFLANAKKNLGDLADESVETLTAAWQQIEADGVVTPLEVDADDKAAVSRLARKLARSLVEAGVTERDAVVDAVHKELAKAIPSFTRRQAMDAISMYGQFTQLNKDQASTIIRDISGQLQQLAKLEDMSQGRAPAKTGVERREPSDEERRLIQQVNEAKKRGGFSVTDPAKQLKTSLDAAKTAIRNRIADMEEEIRTKAKIVKNRTPLTADAELTALRKQRDELKAEYAAVFPKQPATQAQKIASAGKALDRAITQLEADLKAGNIAPKKRAAPITAPALDAKRARLAELRQQRDELRDAANPKKTPEEIATAAYKRSLLKRLADLQQRIANEDFSKRVTKKTVLDQEATDLKFQVAEARSEFQAMEAAMQRAQRTPVQKALGTVPEVLNASRAILTSMDLSAVLRQGGFSVVSHPILAAKAFPAMFKAFRSPKGEFEAVEELRQRPNAKLYEQAKLAITVTEGKLSKQEEQFMGRWAKAIPGVAGSERAYVTFLNRMRADVFDSLAATLSADSALTDEEARVIANFVNVSTGRAPLGKMESAAVPLATIFFSPRYMVSRFQLLMGQPLWKGNARTRRLIAQEYAKALIGIGTFYGLVMAMSDDDDKPTIEFDARSSDFGKVRWGDVRVDPLFGLSQTAVFVTRTALGKTKSATGEIIPIRGDGVPMAGMTTQDVITRFLRSKLSPWLGSAVDIVSGENIVGEKTTPAAVATRSFTPLAMTDVYEAIRDLGVKRGSALSLCAIFGMGIQNYSGGGIGSFADKIARREKLTGRSKGGESFDYRDEVGQIVSQAKKLGISETELTDALTERMRAGGSKKDTINAWKTRLRKRYREN